MTLHDDRTGRRWAVRDMAEAYRRASRLGLKEYTVCPEGTEPDTILQTATAMRAAMLGREG